MKILKQKSILVLVLLLIISGVLLPVIDIQAAVSIIDQVRPECKNVGDCNFCDVMRVIYNVGRFIFSAMIGVAMILFLWAGIGLIMNWGNAEMISANKKLLVNTVAGLVIILLAWVLVDALLFLGLGAQKAFFTDGMWWTGPKCS